MVLRCAWGICNGDERYPDRMGDGKLIRFPKPKTSKEKCIRWIKACGRPHAQLNIDCINQHKAVCSKHFVGGDGPTPEYPDPIQADGSVTRPSRKAPKRRIAHTYTPQIEKTTETDATFVDKTLSITPDSHSKDCSAQTVEQYVSPVDVLALTAENDRLKMQLEQQRSEILQLTDQVVRQHQLICLSQQQTFTVESFKERSDKDILFSYYTSLTYLKFCSLVEFLLSDGCTVNYKSKENRTEVRNMSNENCVFITLCRLRHNFGLQDIAVRFNISIQSAGTIFNTWIDHMYNKFGRLSIWPHRDKIINDMPDDYKKSFPTCLIIIDGTEFKTQTPTALGLQSMMYSDYKSSTTFKGLIGCDPNGSLMYVSQLFTGCISDKELTEKCGFYEVIKIMKVHGYVKEGDAVMADKGFTIKNELNELGIKLNIPPFCTSTSQMPVGDAALTCKIAKHRIHIERLIARVKCFSILSNKIPTVQFKNFNQIWTVCCFMTLFQEGYVK